MSAKVTVGLFLLSAIWFAKLPDIERWHDELRVSREWSPSGEAIADSRDALGNRIESGSYVLFVMSDCQECSYRSIPREVILERAKREPVIVAFKNSLQELGSSWSGYVPNVFILVKSEISLPVEWAVRAPFAVNVMVRSEGIKRIVIMPKGE